MPILKCPHCDSKFYVIGGTTGTTCKNCKKFFSTKPDKPFDKNDLPTNFIINERPGVSNIITKSNNFK